MPVIPVLLPNASSQPELPLFLENFTWVELRGGLNQENIEKLVWGITGVKLKVTSTQSELNLVNSNQTISKLLFPKKPDSEFLIEIKQTIANQINPSELDGFRHVLSQELNSVLKNIQQTKLVNNTGESIAEGLIIGLRMGGNPPPVINEAILSSAIICLDEDRVGGTFHANMGKHGAIKQAIEQLLGWLVLASVDDSFTQNLANTKDIFFDLPVLTLGGVEILLSRCFQRQAKLSQEGTKLLTNYILDVSSHIGLSEWTARDIVDQLKMLIWNQVFPDRKKAEVERVMADEIEELNHELALRRSTKEEKYKEHHVMAFKESSLPNEWLQREVYQQLFQELSNLTLVRFGVKGQQDIFCVPEFALIASVRSVLTHINNFSKP